MRKAARRLVTTYIQQYAADLHRVWAVERPFALHLDEGIVSGRADVILDEEGGQRGALAIVDYKVATDEAREPRYEEQLRVYSVAGRGEGLNVEAAYLHELRDGSRRSVDITEVPSGNAMTAVSARVRELRAGAFVPKPADEKCGRCEYSRVCAHTAATDTEG
jgi:DNA helicase-2/ATP-dependent DNA helicase PcrA